MSATKRKSSESLATLSLPRWRLLAAAWAAKEEAEQARLAAKAASKRLVAEVFAKVIAKFAGAEEESERERDMSGVASAGPAIL